MYKFNIMFLKREFYFGFSLLYFTFLFCFFAFASFKEV